MKNKLNLFVLLLTLSAPFLCAQDALTSEVEIDSDVTVENKIDDIDVRGGKWFIKLNRDKWVKIVSQGRFTLYPDKADRTQAVIDAQAAFESDLASYIKLALDGCFYANSRSGVGLTLEAPFELKYHAVNYCSDMPCQIYTRVKNKEYALKLYPNEEDESQAAKDLRTNMSANLKIIEDAAEAGTFYGD